MIQYEPDSIIQQLDAMPRVVRNYIHDPKTGEQIRTIGQKHGMLLDQIAALVDETTWVMIGLTSQTAFKDRIKETFGLPEDKANAITKEIGDIIVQPILNELRNDVATPSIDTETISRQEIDALVNEKIPGIDYDVETPGLEQSGIEVVAEPEQMQTQEIVGDRESMIKRVENPGVIPGVIPPAMAADEIQRGITGEKLAGNFKIPAETKDYSVNKPTGEPLTQVKIIRHSDRVDPYKESLDSII